MCANDKNMKTENKQLLKLFGELALVAIILFSFAPKSFATDYVPLAPIPGTTLAGGGTDLPTYLAGVFKVGIAVAGALAFLVIVYGGFIYLSTDAITGKEEGKAYIGRAIGGLILALAAYIILNTINPAFVSLNLDFGPSVDPKKYLSTPIEPKSPAWQTQFDKKIADLHATLTDTKTTARAIENTVSGAIEARDSILAWEELGNPLTLEEEIQLQDLNAEIDAAYKKSQALRSLETTKVMIKSLSFDNLAPHTDATIGGYDTTVASDPFAAARTIRDRVNKDIKNVLAAGLTDQATELRNDAIVAMTKICKSTSTKTTSFDYSTGKPRTTAFDNLNQKDQAECLKMAPDPIPPISTP